MVFGLAPFETDYDWLVDTVMERDRQPEILTCAQTLQGQGILWNWDGIVASN